MKELFFSKELILCHVWIEIHLFRRYFSYIYNYFLCFLATVISSYLEEFFNLTFLLVRLIINTIWLRLQKCWNIYLKGEWIEKTEVLYWHWNRLNMFLLLFFSLDLMWLCSDFSLELLVLLQCLLQLFCYLENKEDIFYSNSYIYI